MGHGSIVFEGTPADAARQRRRSARSGSRSEPRSAMAAACRRCHLTRQSRAVSTPRIERSFFFLPSTAGASRRTAMSASYEVRGDVAVITLNNPPVNGLGYDTRAGIADGARPGATPTRRSRRSSSPAPARRSPAAPTSASSARPRRWPSRTCCRVILALESCSQAGGRRDPQRVHGRRPGARARLPLPRRRARRADRAARSEARPGARRRRHAAPAARARRRDGAEHDRQRRAGEERAAGAGCRARSCSTRWSTATLRRGGDRLRRARWPTRGRCRWCAT